jgi:hypothetical protein
LLLFPIPGGEQTVQAPFSRGHLALFLSFLGIPVGEEFQGSFFISTLSNGGVCFKYCVFGETFIRTGLDKPTIEKVMV